VNPFPPAPTPGAPISAAWMSRFIAACRMCLPLAGNGTRISYTANGAVIHSTATGYKAVASGLQPFAVRYHDPVNAQGQSTGHPQWEIYLPTGCLAVGATCTPINATASDTESHGGEDGWYLLALDETAGTVETTGSGADATSFKQWMIIVHAKTSAKVTGVDALDADPRRLFYVSARPAIRGSISAADWYADERGDTFSQVVAEVTITQPSGGQGEPGRSVKRFVTAPISVQAPGTASSGAGANFDLVWYFSTSNGALQLDKLYTIRNNLSVAGMAVEGDTMKDVSAAVADASVHKVFVKVNANPGSGANTVEALVDPNPTGDDDFITWLDIYHIRNGCVEADYRLSALANVQVYR